MPAPNPSAAHQIAAEMAARASYGRLLAAICRRTGDIAAAEDALAEAFAAALGQWPRQGVPQSPEAWLLTVARRKWLDQRRRQRPEAGAGPLDQIPAPSAPFWSEFPDSRLGLLFLCAHPAIRADCHTPLMLQSVLGLSAERIAQLLLDSPQALRQRLARAKAKIRANGLRFEPPERSQIAVRLEAVLEAVYGAAATGLGAAAEANLGGEAEYLAGLLAALLPTEPEALGLAALVSFLGSREAARQGPEGEFVPLEGQDASRWDAARIQTGRELLARAASVQRLGRFQIEAAIQAAHALRADGRAPDRAAILGLYDLLLQFSPSLGAQVSAAAACAQAQGAAAALERLNQLPEAAVAAFQPYWCVRAYLLAQTSHPAAAEAYQRAIGLTADPAHRAFLSRQAAGGAP